MYAVIEDSGTQFKVSQGDCLEVDLRAAQAGQAIEFDKVLFCSTDAGARVGAPYVEGAKVRAEVQEEFKARKVISYRFRRRKKSAKKIGHRQRYLRVRVTDIIVP